MLTRIKKALKKKNEKVTKYSALKFSEENSPQ